MLLVFHYNENSAEAAATGACQAIRGYHPHLLQVSVADKRKPFFGTLGGSV
jgi:hypothetical protein